MSKFVDGQEGDVFVLGWLLGRRFDDRDFDRGFANLVGTANPEDVGRNEAVGFRGLPHLGVVGKVRLDTAEGRFVLCIGKGQARHLSKRLQIVDREFLRGRRCRLLSQRHGRQGDSRGGGDRQAEDLGARKVRLRHGRQITGGWAT